MTLSLTNRTQLNTLIGNLDIGDIADPALRAAVFQHIYSTLDAIIADSNTAQEIGAIGSVVDGSVTLTKLGTDVRRRRIYKVVW